MDSKLDEYPSLVKFFVACQLTACVGFIVVLMTALISRNVRRHLTWYSFCASWAVSGASYSLLTLTGQQFTTRPVFGVCLFQSAMIYASPTLTASTTIALVLHLWFNVRLMLGNQSPSGTLRDIGLTVVPYITAIIVLVISLADGATNRTEVAKSYLGAYCVINTGVPGTIVRVWVALAMVVAGTFEVLIALTLYRNWRAFRDLGARSRHSLSIMIRVVVFSCFDILALFVCLIMFAAPNITLPDMILAILPIAALCIFGTQKDLLCVWMFWKQPSTKVEPWTSNSIEGGARRSEK